MDDFFTIVITVLLFVLLVIAFYLGQYFAPHKIVEKEVKVNVSQPCECTIDYCVKLLQNVTDEIAYHRMFMRSRG